MIKTVIFDLGKVLVNYDVKRAGLKFAQAAHVNFVRVIMYFFTSPFEREYTCGRISSYEFYRRSKETLKLEMSYREFRDTWNDIFWDNPGIEKILARLKKHYPLYLISNTNSMHFSHIKKNHPKVLRYFKRLFPSHEMGCRKPDPKIFRKVLRMIKYKPKETVFIDDMKEFVDGARQVGMNAIRYRNHDQLVSDLRKLGVRI